MSAAEPSPQAEETPPRRLSGWDFATWRAASDDPTLRSTIVGLLLLEKAPDFELLKDRFDRASRNVVILRQKVVEGPLGYETPRMVVDPNFDLDFHLRRMSMPKRSSWADVLEVARTQSMTDFDRERPLWRMTLLEDLPGGKAALIAKLHHAIADGQGAVMLGASIFDFTDTPADLGPMPPVPPPTDMSSLDFADAVVRDNISWITKSAQDLVRGIAPTTWQGLKDPSAFLRGTFKTLESVLRMTQVNLGPLSPLMKQRSINYHFDTFDLPFTDIKAAAKGHERTANDVFLTAVAEGLGEYHRRMGKPTDKLRVNMPISIRRTGDDMDSNAVSIARFELPVSGLDVSAIMDHVADTVQNWRNEPALAYMDEIAELSRLIPSELIAAVAQSSDITASNVPGVPVPVWIAGVQIEAMYPLVATIGAAVNITMLTYNGTASVGISSDDAAIDDREELIRCLKWGFRSVTGKSVTRGTPLRKKRTSATDATTT